jgi:hypothetical protein
MIKTFVLEAKKCPIKLEKIIDLSKKIDSYLVNKPSTQTEKLKAALSARDDLKMILYVLYNELRDLIDNKNSAKYLQHIIKKFHKIIFGLDAEKFEIIMLPLKPNPNAYYAKLNTYTAKMIVIKNAVFYSIKFASEKSSNNKKKFITQLNKAAHVATKRLEKCPSLHPNYYINRFYESFSNPPTKFINKKDFFKKNGGDI